MSTKIISDFLLENMAFHGGAEYNDNEIYKGLKSKNIPVDYLRSGEVTLGMVNSFQKSDTLIISNFIYLDESVKDYITKNLTYIIWEHDHKYLVGRNPSLHLNFQAPKEKIINYEFYKNSKFVVCQTDFHKKIVEKNLRLENIISVAGNFWSTEDLQHIKKLSKTVDKTSLCSIMKSEQQNKNMHGAISYCQKNKIDYELINDSNYKSFLAKMAKNSKFLFLPTTPETLSRVCVEAKMLGNSVLTNNLVGCKHEPWFRHDSQGIIDYMLEFSDKTIDYIISEL